MNYLKSVITCIARHLSDHAVLPPHVKRFSPAGSRQLEIDGDTSPHFSSSSTIHTNYLQSVRSFAIQVGKLSYLLSIESF
jgi:hypothetical protein